MRSNCDITAVIVCLALSVGVVESVQPQIPLIVNVREIWHKEDYFVPTGKITIEGATGVLSSCVLAGGTTCIIDDWYREPGNYQLSVTLHDPEAKGFHATTHFEANGPELTVRVYTWLTINEGPPWVEIWTEVVQDGSTRASLESRWRPQRHALAQYVLSNLSDADIHGTGLGRSFHIWIETLANEGWIPIQRGGICGFGFEEQVPLSPEAEILVAEGYRFDPEPLEIGRYRAVVSFETGRDYEATQHHELYDEFEITEADGVLCVAPLASALLGGDLSLHAGDGAPVEFHETQSRRMDGLSLGQRHLIRIYETEGLIESFYFTFEGRDSELLCLEHRQGSWRLEPLWKRNSCECEQSEQGDESNRH